MHHFYCCCSVNLRVLFRSSSDVLTIRRCLKIQDVSRSRAWGSFLTEQGKKCYGIQARRAEGPLPTPSHSWHKGLRALGQHQRAQQQTQSSPEPGFKIKKALVQVFMLWKVYRVETLGLLVGWAFCHFSSRTITTGVTESRSQKQRKFHTTGWEKCSARHKNPPGAMQHFGCAVLLCTGAACPSPPHALSGPTPRSVHCVVYVRLFLILFSWGLTQTQRWSTVKAKHCTALRKPGHRSL